MAAKISARLRLRKPAGLTDSSAPAAGDTMQVCFAAKDASIGSAAAFARNHLSARCEVVSDGLWCFEAVKAVGATHRRTVTGGGLHSVSLPQFKAVNTALSNLKTAISGTYHAFDFRKYGHRYLAEAQYRFNRRFDLSVILPRLLRAAALTPKQPERIIRLAELHR